MLTMDTFDFAGKKALVRVDVNVPQDANGKVTDDSRAKAIVPTVNKILKDGGSVSSNVVAGNTYTFSTCTGTTFDSQITLYNNAGGAALGYNDDGCGLQSTVTWTATYTGQLRVLVDQYNCTNNSICGTLTINCTSAGASPCTAVNIPSLPVTGQSVVCHGSNLISTANVLSLCGSASNLYLGGNEALYTVTPTTTGSYTFSNNGQTWTSIWLFTGACPAAGGSCVASESSAAASQTLIASLTAGVQYWVLFDTWPTPISPCQIISE